MPTWTYLIRRSNPTGSFRIERGSIELDETNAARAKRQIADLKGVGTRQVTVSKAKAGA